MDFDFVFPVFNDIPNHLWLADAKKKSAWQVPKTVSEFEFLEDLADELRRAGKTVAFLVTTARIQARLRTRFEHVFDLYEGLERRRPVPPDEIWAVERRYGLTSLRSFVYPEHAYDWALDYDDLLPRAVHVLAWLERFVSAHRVGSFVNNVGCEVIRRSISVIAERHGIGNAVFDFAALPGRFVIASNEHGIRIPRVPDTAAPEELAWAGEYVASMLHARRPWAPASALGFGRANFLGALAALGATRYQKDVSLGRLVDERLRRVVRRVAGGALWQPVDPDERYIFFPIHLPNDSAVTVRAPQFQRQEELVQYIADRALPAGVALYVKPHIGARDSFTLDSLARFRRIPSVRLVAPATNPYDIIERALMTVVINSTAGFESVLHGKPTVVLGNPWYAGQGLTIDVEKLSELPAAVERALSFTPPRERLLTFLAHYRHLTHEGVYGLPAPENVARIARVLLEHEETRRAGSTKRGEQREHSVGGAG